MTHQTLCEMCGTTPAEKHVTWVNDGGSGIGGGLQGCPMCYACGQNMWDALSRFPNAASTVTLYPLSSVLPYRGLAI